MPQYMVRHQSDPPKPDGYLPDGTPVYFRMARGNGKSMLQLKMYANLCGVSDEEFAKMYEEVKEKMYGKE